MEYYIKAKECLDIDATEFTGAVSIAEIEKAEKMLNVTFPESYKAFLKEFGAGDVGGEIIFGIVKDDRKDEDVNMVKITQMEHDYKMPKHMIVIHYSEYDDCLYCLDTSKMNSGECPVVAVPDDYININMVANTFGEFFYQMVCEDE